MNKTASTRGREQENKRMDGKGKAYTYFTLTRAIVKRKRARHTRITEEGKAYTYFTLTRAIVKR